jgi:hypothetical protein
MSVQQYIIAKQYYEDGLYSLHKIYTNGKTEWRKTIHWEEDVYNVIKNLKEPVIYNGQNAVPHFNSLSTNKKERLYTAEEVFETCFNEAVARAEDYHRDNPH